LFEAAFEGFFDDGVGNVFGGAGGYRGFDEDQALRIYFFTDHFQAVFEGGYVGMALAHVAQGFFQVVALHVHDDDVGKGEGVVGEGGGKGLLLENAAADHGSHFRVLGLDRGEAAVDVVDLPKGAGRGALHADNEFRGIARLLIHRVGDDTGHDDDDFTAEEALLVYELLEALELPGVFGRLREREGFTGGAGGNRRFGRVLLCCRGHMGSFGMGR